MVTAVGNTAGCDSSHCSVDVDLNELDASHFSFRRSKRQYRTEAVSSGRASLCEADRPAPAHSICTATASHIVDHQPFQCAPPRRTAAELQARTLHTGWRSSAGCVPLESHCYSTGQSGSKQTSIHTKHAPLAIPRAVSDGTLCGPALLEPADSDFSGRPSDASGRLSTNSSTSGVGERSSICFATLARQLSHGNLACYSSRPLYATSSGRGSLDSTCPSSDGDRYSYERGQRRSADLCRSSSEWYSSPDASEQIQAKSYALPPLSPRQHCESQSATLLPSHGSALPQALAAASISEDGPSRGHTSVRLAVSTRRCSVEGLSEQSSDGGEVLPRHTSSVSVFPAATAFPTPATITAAPLPVAMDSDCCEDSGAEGLLRPSLRTSSEPMYTGSKADSASCEAALLETVPSVPQDAFPHALNERKENGSMHKWSSMSDGQAAVDLFWRLNHARQTVDFVHQQRAAFCKLDKAVLGPLEALALHNSLREYESALLGEASAVQGAELDSDMPLLEHAFQTAEACRLAHPQHEWLHVVGLLHGLGKLLAHPTFGAQPQWAVCGESFPVGCAHSPLIACPQGFSVNPDRRRRVYNTPTGMYKTHCGLRSVYMSWSASEYIHMVLQGSGAQLPPEALFVLRYQKAHSFCKGAYLELMDEQDRSFLPWLASFQELAVYQRRELPGRLWGTELHEYYSQLLAKFGIGPMRW